MQRQQVLVAAVAATALLAFGVAADGLGTDPPPVGQQPEQTGDQESLPQLPELWEFPACDPCDVETQSLVASGADSLPPIVLAGLAAFGALAIGGAYLSAGGGDETIQPDPDDGDSLDDVARTGSRPTATADAADVPLSNDVYRAWRDMTDRVPGVPEHVAGGPDRAATDRALTPREYADAAREEGLDPDAVETLTGLFREVRYGGAAPTDERERRARDARDALDEPTSEGRRDDRSDDPTDDHTDDRSDAGGER